MVPHPGRADRRAYPLAWVVAMKLYALSIRQPWAWAILYAGKDVENRSWVLPASHVGKPVLIHAGLREDKMAKLSLSHDGGFNIPKYLPQGGIVGIMMFYPGPLSLLSPWIEPGLNHWPICHAEELPWFPCKGRLGFFEVDYPHALPDFTEWQQHRRNSWNRI